MTAVWLARSTFSQLSGPSSSFRPHLFHSLFNLDKYQFCIGHLTGRMAWEPLDRPSQLAQFGILLLRWCGTPASQKKPEGRPLMFKSSQVRPCLFPQSLMSQGFVLDFILCISQGCSSKMEFNLPTTAPARQPRRPPGGFCIATATGRAVSVPIGAPS